MFEPIDYSKYSNCKLTQAIMVALELKAVKDIHGDPNMPFGTRCRAAEEILRLENDLKKLKPTT